MKLMLKTPAFILALIISPLILFSGCSNNLLSEARQSDVISTTGLSKKTISEYDYGKIAYKYLEYLQDNLPGRIPFTEKEKETAIFILSALLDMGYTSDSINVQSFSVNITSSAIQDSVTDYNGGKRLNKSQNIIVTQKGNNEKVIVVAAHYDCAGTHGIDDNGSGLSIVLENAMRMIGKETPYTIKYIFFGAEEIATWGSRHYIESLSDNKKQNILLMVNIDSVIGSDIFSMSGGEPQNDGTVRNDWAVMQAFEYVENLELNISLPAWKKFQQPFPVGTLSGDHIPFMESGITYIQFDAVNWDEPDSMIMHSQNDNLEYINSLFPNRVKSSLESYSILLEYMLNHIAS